MKVLAQNSYLAFKQAINIALGGKSTKRPVFKSRDLYGLTFQDELGETEYIFGELNNSYIEQLYSIDVSVFTEEDFGKFFYEYGRVLLGNLMICLTKADWNSVAVGSMQEASYVTNYYNALVKMDNVVDKVFKDFENQALNDNYNSTTFNITKVSYLLKKYKEEVASNKYSRDMYNTEIYISAYVGLLFTLYGLFIILCSKDKNVFSYMRSPKSESFMTIYEIILKGKLDSESKKHFMTMIYAFYIMTKHFIAISGLTEVNKFIGTMYDIAEKFVSKLPEDRDELLNMIDEDFIDEASAGGVSLKTFTTIYDPIQEVYGFRNSLIKNDNTNIFLFGDEFVNIHNYDIEDDNIVSKLDASGKEYLNQALKGSYTNEEVEKAFCEVSNIVNAIDEYSTGVFGQINPATLMQLTLFVSALRVLSNRSTQRSDKVKAELNASIDIIDVFIIKIYDNWFNSKKYFIQQIRPKYSNDDSCNKTLKYLKWECDSILASYLEFVRFGINISDSDKTLFKTLKSKRILEPCYEHLNEFVGNLLVNQDPDAFIAHCASKTGRSLVQSCFYSVDNKYSFANIVKGYSAKELSKDILNTFAKTSTQHTGVEIIDKVINTSIKARNEVSSNPEYYCIAIFAVIWIYFDGLLRKNNVGNYFDFGDADNSLDQYFVESVVKDKVATALKRQLAFNTL